MARFALLSVIAVGLLPTVAYADVESTCVVHIDSPVPVVLERRAARDTPWQTVCASPCDEALPRDGDYRVAGTASPSAPFHLVTPGERVVLRVDPDGGDRRTVGTIFVAFGGIALGGGFVALLVAATKDASSGWVVGSSARTHSSSTTETTLAVVFVVTGVVSLVGGLGLRANAATTVEASPAPPPSDRWRRSPDLPGAGWSAPKPRVESPLFVVRF